MITSLHSSLGDRVRFNKSVCIEPIGVFICWGNGNNWESHNQTDRQTDRSGPLHGAMMPWPVGLGGGM